jgi:Leucine-rich repeat (LRR) protein
MLFIDRVEVLYLGGNRISYLPESIGSMCSLVVLNLCDNRLKTLPHSISRRTIASCYSFHLCLFVVSVFHSGLTRLKSLSLHNNYFSALPSDIIRLDLQELSLRNNPLVVRDLTYDVPRLKELAGRMIKLHQVVYDDGVLPKNLVDYLNGAKSCLNPKCQGLP